MSFAEHLSQYDQEWEEIEVRSGGGGLPEGTYQAKIVVSRVEESNWGDTQLALGFEDLGGKGMQMVWDNLDSEIGRSIAKSHLAALGWDDKLSDLPAACEAGLFDNLVVDIRVKDNVKDEKVYKAVYINRLYGTSANPGGSASADDDDVPF